MGRGVRDGAFAYVAKTKDDKYQPFEYKNSNFQSQQGISPIVKLII